MSKYLGLTLKTCPFIFCQLYRALDDRDYIIAQLERKLENNDDFKREGQEERYEQLVSDYENARKEISDSKHTISELDAIINQYSVENETLKEDKRQLEKQIQSQHGVLEVQKKKLFAAERRSDDVKRRQRGDTDEQYRLELENQRYEAY